MPRIAARVVVEAQAIKASGAIVQVEPETFLGLLRRTEAPLVVRAQGRLWRSNHYYLTAYKGLIFATKCDSALEFAPEVEMIAARDIWLPT